MGVVSLNYLPPMEPAQSSTLVLETTSSAGKADAAEQEAELMNTTYPGFSWRGPSIHLAPYTKDANLPISFLLLIMPFKVI